MSKKIREPEKIAVDLGKLAEEIEKSIPFYYLDAGDNCELLSIAERMVKNARDLVRKFGEMS